MPRIPFSLDAASAAGAAKQLRAYADTLTKTSELRVRLRIYRYSQSTGTIPRSSPCRARTQCFSNTVPVSVPAARARMLKAV